MPNTNSSSRKGKSSSTSHVFRGCREPLLNNIVGGTGVSSSIMTANAASDGSSSYGIVLAPLGLSGSVLSAGTTYSDPASGVTNISGPPLRGLYNRAVDFQWYRVTRAKLIFVGNQGVTVVGNIVLAAYTDAMDIAPATTIAFTSGASSKVFDLASAGTKELSIPIPVDSSWKKVSSVTSRVGNSFPFAATAPNVSVPVNTINDLAFGAVTMRIGSNVVSGGTIGGLYVDYDVEFKGPIDFGVNF